MASKFLFRRRTYADPIETLRAYARHERSLGAEGPMIELMNAKQEIERLRADVTTLHNSLNAAEAEIERLSTLLLWIAQSPSTDYVTVQKITDALTQCDR